MRHQGTLSRDTGLGNENDHPTGDERHVVRVILRGGLRDLDVAMTDKPPLRQVERIIEQAPRSWWLEQETRDGFTSAAERELTRMKRSKAYTQGGSMVVGQIKEK